MKNNKPGIARTYEAPVRPNYKPIEIIINLSDKTFGSSQDEENLRSFFIWGSSLEGFNVKMTVNQMVKEGIFTIDLLYKEKSWKIFTNKESEKEEVTIVAENFENEEVHSQIVSLIKKLTA